MYELKQTYYEALKEAESKINEILKELDKKIEDIDSNNTVYSAETHNLYNKVSAYAKLIDCNTNRAFSTVFDLIRLER